LWVYVELARIVGMDFGFSAATEATADRVGADSIGAKYFFWIGLVLFHDGVEVQHCSRKKLLHAAVLVGFPFLRAAAGMRNAYVVQLK
jgi:hypothetical protein